jgi:RNA polymerase sigma-70 factor (ECF subfamily)
MKDDRIFVVPGPDREARERLAVVPVPGSDAYDAVLLARSRLDADAFTAVYDQYFPVIHRYVAGRLGSQAADDLAAEAFLVAFRKRERFDPAQGAVRPWLFGIATNLIAQHRRAEVRRYRAMARSGPVPAVESHEGSVVASLSAGGLRPELARALAALSQGERDVVLLAAFGGLYLPAAGHSDLLFDPHTYQVEGRLTISTGHYPKAEQVTAKAKGLKLLPAGAVIESMTRTTTLVSGPGRS